MRRSTTPRHRMTWAAVVTVGVALAAPIAARAQEPYRIGALFPMTGPMAVFGEVFRAGVDLAIEHVRTDGRLGRPLEIQYEDSQGQVQPTLIGMNKLVRVDRVPYVLVGLASASKMVAPIVERERVVAMNGSASMPDLGELSGFFWNVIPLADFELQTLVPLAKQGAIYRVALVYNRDPQDRVLRSLEAALGASGIELAGSFAVEPYDTGFSELADKLRETKPDAICLAAAGPQQRDLIQQLRDGGVEGTLLGSSSFLDSDLVRMPAAEGALFASQKLALDSSDPTTVRFVRDFVARQHRQPSSYAAHYYNAVIVYAEVLKDLEARQMAPSGQAIRDALQRIRRFDLVA